MGEVRVAKVPLDRVQFHRHNVRRDLGDLRPLANSIKRFGVMQPIVVEKYGESLRLRAGHRRVAAARIAGLKTVPALIHDKALDDDEWLIQSVQENVMRRGIDEHERRDAIRALRDLGCTWEGIADTFAASTKTVQVWGGYLSPQQRSRATLGRPLKVSTVRTFVKSWRDVDASAGEVLDALEQMADSGRIALPDELARRRRMA
jgi:ParB/RepB/Spo0J family partition protein